MGVPTLMAGNAVLLKHAHNCFGSGLLCEELINDLDLPEGLFRSLIVDVPETHQVLEHPLVQGVALTGSEVAGRAVAAKAGSLLKKAVVELGGSDAYAILADCDLDQAATAVVDARVANAGQTCIAPKRCIVEKSVKAAFEEKVVEKVKGKLYGSDYGPLVHPVARDQVAKQVRDSMEQGAKLLYGGEMDRKGVDCKSFFAPTVLTDVTPGMTAFEHEIFGPVISIVEAQDEAEVIRLANQTSYGLAGAIFTSDRHKGERMAVEDIDAGNVLRERLRTVGSVFAFWRSKELGLRQRMCCLWDVGVCECQDHLCQVSIRRKKMVVETTTRWTWTEIRHAQSGHGSCCFQIGRGRLNH